MHEFRCPYDEGALSPRNGGGFEAIDASESGRGRIVGEERLAGAEFLEAGDFLRADATELWAAATYEEKQSDEEPLSEERALMASAAETDISADRIPEVGFYEEMPTWEEEARKVTADLGTDIADQTKERGQETGIENSTKSVMVETREWSQKVADWTKEWGARPEL